MSEAIALFENKVLFVSIPANRAYVSHLFPMPILRKI